MPSLRKVLFVVAAVCALPAQALTVGSLSRADGSPLIIDTANNREWLGWDINKELSYTETLAVIAPGGAYQGFQMANQSDALLFAAALRGPDHGCVGVLPPWLGVPGALPPNPWCGPVPAATRSLVGDNGGPMDTASDEIYFLSQDARFEVGKLEVGQGAVQADADFYFGSYWGSFAEVQARHGQQGALQYDVPWLLYRDMVSPVPEPRASLMLGAGIVVLAAWRRRRPRA